MKQLLALVVTATLLLSSEAGPFPRKYKHVLGYLSHKHFLDFDYEDAFGAGISDLVFHALEINSLGNPSDRTRRRMPTHETARRAKKAAQHVGGRILFSIGSTIKKPAAGREEEEKEKNPYAEVVAKPELRQNFVNTVKTMISEYGFDGVDIFWQFPEKPEHFEGLLSLLKEVRAAIPDHLLTFSINEDTALLEKVSFFRMYDYVDYMVGFAFGREDIRFFGTFGGTLQMLNSMRVEFKMPMAKVICGAPLFAMNIQDNKKVAFADVFDKLDNDTQIELNETIRVSSREITAHRGLIARGYKTAGLALFELGYDIQPISDNRSLTTSLFDGSNWGGPDGDHRFDMPDPDEWMDDDL